MNRIQPFETRQPCKWRCGVTRDTPNRLSSHETRCAQRPVDCELSQCLLLDPCVQARLEVRDSAGSDWWLLPPLSTRAAFVFLSQVYGLERAWVYRLALTTHMVVGNKLGFQIQFCRRRLRSLDWRSCCAVRPDSQ